MIKEQLVRAKEAAEAVGMSTHSLYVLAKRGQLPSYLAGPKLKGVRFSVPELRAALKRPSAAEQIGHTKQRRPRVNHVGSN